VARRNRERKPPRRDAYLEPRRRLLVVCEGEITEVHYLQDFKRWCSNSRVELRIENKAGVPFPLVTKAKELNQEADRRAKAEQDDNLRYDEVWCVFDVDDHPRLKEAREMARANGLSLAMSNPCFELWLLLHLRDNPGAQHRDRIQSMLKALMPGVADKYIDFELLIAGYSDAVRRAERLERESRERGDEGTNPSTEVFRLTRSIEDGAAAGSSRRQDPGLAKAAVAAAAALEQAKREAAEMTDSEE
jgi:hypothetical protein